MGLIIGKDNIPYIPATNSNFPKNKVAFAGLKSDVFVRSNTNVSFAATKKSEQKGLDVESAGFMRWTDKQVKNAKALHPDWNLYIPEVKTDPMKAQLSPEQKDTINLFKKNFSTFMWTGEECSNPIWKNEKTGKEERWDELDMIKMYDSKERKKHIAKMKQLGIENVRLGMPNHLIVKEGEWNWKPFSELVKDYKDAGIKISLDLQHFGLPDSMKSDDPEKSYYLNPAWPQHHREYTAETLKRHFDDIEAFTLVNEPLVTNKFSSCWWNESMPGSGKPGFDHYFIERALLIAKAAIGSRLEMEEFARANNKERKVIVHNDSCEYQRGNKVYNDYMRFLSSDLILGQDWLTKGDYKQSEMYKWMKESFVRPDHVEEDTAKLNSGIEEILSMHKELNDKYNKTMKTDTVFGVDYYIACETDAKPDGQEKVTWDIKNYADEIKGGHRRGLAGIVKEYYDRYKLPILHTETNFVDETSPQWATQQMIELASVAKEGIPVLGFNWYSLMDQFGWNCALNCSPEDAQVNKIGLFSADGKFTPRGVASETIPDLNKEIKPEKVNNIKDKVVDIVSSCFK